MRRYMLRSSGSHTEVTVLGQEEQDLKASLGGSGVEVSIQPCEILWESGMGRPRMWLSGRTPAYSPPVRGYSCTFLSLGCSLCQQK